MAADYRFERQKIFSKQSRSRHPPHAKTASGDTDQRNYHLFQPLLYQVATAALSPADVAWPIRGIFAKTPNVRVALGKVGGRRSRELGRALE